MQNIRDNYEKIVLTADLLTAGNYNGIQVKNFMDWLLEIVTAASAAEMEEYLDFEVPVLNKDVDGVKTEYYKYADTTYTIWEQNGFAFSYVYAKDGDAEVKALIQQCK